MRDWNYRINFTLFPHFVVYSRTIYHRFPVHAQCFEDLRKLPNLGLDILYCKLKREADKVII